MDCPNIALFPRYCHETVFEDMIEQNAVAFYRSIDNTIYLRHGIEDNNADIILVHELAHWASIQSLRIGEQWDIIEKRKDEGLIFERIAYWTELFLILDELERHFSIDEAYLLVASGRSKWRHLLGINQRHWWLIALLYNCTHKLNIVLRPEE